MAEIMEKNIEFERIEDAINLFGNFDENIRIIEELFGVRASVIENTINIKGPEDQVAKASATVCKLLGMAEKGDVITTQNVRYIADMAAENDKELEEDLGGCICVTAKGKQIKTKTLGQKKYVDSIKNNVVSFGIGPAGTGKTFLAVAMAENAFKNKEVSRIILTRPAVEAGEKLGFLPGDLQNKVDPYLRPLYDSLYEIMGADNYLKYMERGIIEIAPLAYMRGRTLDDSFIILDEAQNTTPEQMKMFLTRIGFGSKAVINGDITQVDLPKDKTSGLREVVNVLKDVEGIGFVFLSDKDVVRHELVRRIIRAYEKFDGR